MIDLQSLPAPNVVEVLDFEALVSAHKQDLLQRHPAAANVLALPSEPLVKQIEAFSYREMLLRGRINDAARANLLAFATGTDLDHKGAFYDLARMQGEADERYRSRIQLRIASMAGNGTAEQYRLHALSASQNVKDASITRNGAVVHIVLWLINDEIRAETMASVEAELMNRPLGVDVSVSIAQAYPVIVIAKVWRSHTAPADLLVQLTHNLQQIWHVQAALGHYFPRSWISAQLHKEGVVRIEYPHMDAPTDYVDLKSHQYPRLDNIELIDAGIA